MRFHFQAEMSHFVDIIIFYLCCQKSKLSRPVTRPGKLSFLIRDTCLYAAFAEAVPAVPAVLDATLPAVPALL